MSNTHSVRTPDIVQAELRAEKRATGLSWRKIAAQRKYSEKGVPAGTLCTIAKTGYIPPKWRPFFGVRALVKVEACPHCGVVHTRKTCPKRRKPRATRLAISKTDVDSAYRSIANNCDKDFIIELAKRLTTDARHPEG